MYDELIIKIRQLQYWFKPNESVSFDPYKILGEAADAIEELSKRPECPCWYGDVRICSLLGMPIAQPPESEE